MTKKIFTFIIIFIIFYEIYLLYLEPKNSLINNKIQLNKVEKSDKENTINVNKLFSFINGNETNNDKNNNNDNDDNDDNNENININNDDSNNIIYSKNEENDEFIERIDPNMFGKPTQYEINNIIVWDNLEQKPWSKIIYKYNINYPFHFYIKIKIPSLNDYNNWKQIISNLEFDPKSGEMVIPTQDEETALSIANLIISNFKGDLTLEEIISKNLIDISIKKAKKYDVVKNKLIEQIMINLNDKPKESFTNTETFTADLAIKNDDFVAYEGIEYSFF